MYGGEVQTGVFDRFLHAYLTTPRWSLTVVLSDKKTFSLWCFGAVRSQSIYTKTLFDVCRILCRRIGSLNLLACMPVLRRVHITKINSKCFSYKTIIIINLAYMSQ